MAERYDAIIVGGGHNGLTCAAYLARAGKSVKVLEARGVVGGAAVTEEFHPGFRNSSCSYMVSMLHPKIQKDLELARHGLRIVSLKQELTIPQEDGGYLMIGPDKEALVHQLDALAPGDGEAYERFEHLLTEVADVVRGLSLKTPPKVKGGWKDLLATALHGAPMRRLSPDARVFFAQLMTMSVGDMLDRWFQGQAVRGAFGFLGSVGNFQSPYTPGTAYDLLHHVFGEATGVKGAWGHVIGGMGAISDAICSDAVEHGADVETSAPVTRIVMENGRAAGVEMQDGRRFKARVVASSAHPKILYERLLQGVSVPAELTRDISGYRSGSGTLRINVALSELPDLKCLPGLDMQTHHQGSILISPSLAYLQRAHDDARAYGYSHRPAIEMWISSTLDSTLAPAGKHVASLFCQHFSPKLPDGRSWDDVKEEAADRVVATLTEFAPNFAKSIVARRVLSPLDLEREYNLISGDIFHGALHLDQLYSMRPSPEAPGYRTPAAGVYMCGSGVHPGGGVSGIPGHNASREILKDMKAAGARR